MGQNASDQVAITHDDGKNTLDFFKHFEIPVPDYLEKVLKKINEADTITIEHQVELKTAIARAIFENKEHPVLKDELFEDVIPECEKEWFDKQFHSEFESLDVD